MEIEKPRHKGRGFGVWEGSVDGQSPAELILDLAPLDTREGIVQMLGDLADFAAVYGVLLVLVAQLTDGRDYSGRTGAPGLLQSAVLHGLSQFVTLYLQVNNTHADLECRALHNGRGDM